jgi:hypothetical protein
MAKPFNELRERLLRAGVAPRHVRRYLAELADHLSDLTAEEERAGRSSADAESAALERLGPTENLAKAMIEQRQFQSWCARAPWAVCTLAPIVLLAGVYCIACLILWSGWKIFLPNSESPFVRIEGLAILYFGVGKWLYFGAPVLIGWGIALIAVRQRFHFFWPVTGLILLALIDSLSQVHANRSAVPDGVGHVSMTFIPGLSVLGVFYGLFHALVILSITVLPYLFWGLQTGRHRRDAGATFQL